jgi:hypothetical protein
VARGEAIEALEQQLRTRAQRLDAWSRRLDTRGERLELLEQRTEAAPKAAPPPPPAAKPAKDRAVFVTVVKSPTAILKEGAKAPVAAAGVSGAMVEKTVVAATVVAFASPSATLSELDGEGIDRIAKQAAQEGCEVLVWARAKDPSLMSEAQRRANDVKARVVAAGPLPEARVVTRTTMRPGAPGVDVVVSALRETAPAAPAATGAAASLESGEAGKRQLRDAIQAVQPSIESCVNELMVEKNRGRAEGVLRITVSQSGRVSRLATGNDLSGERLSECLRAASAKWVFPTTDAEYVVEVPITVIRGGAER